MHTRPKTHSLVPLFAALVAVASSLAAPPVVMEKTVVTASKLPQTIDATAAAITSVSGDDMRARGATDLRGALALASGVEISPGGDAGPASAVPALWGLREFDAFLLVVDGVPWGGAFNPELSTLNLNNVDRIEVLRGSAPVIFGATSFVGVIQIIQHAAGESPSRVSFSAGTHDQLSLAVSGNFDARGAIKHSYLFDADARKFSQDRSSVKRVHGLYRAADQTPAGQLTLDVDLTSLRQEPYSPHPREGDVLTTRFSLDANTNPSDAREDLNRYQANLGLTQHVALGEWISKLSLAHTEGDNTRGFLRGDFATDGVTVNADGFRQSVTTTQFYFDSYLVPHTSAETSWFLGVDWLYGRGRQKSDNFEYAVFPNGRNAPTSTSLHVDESTQLTDRRNFAGLYSQFDWRPTDRWNLNAGLRANRTEEVRNGRVIDRNAANLTTTSADTRSETRLSGSAGANFAAWRNGRDQLNFFADYRNTFKPAAVDFGPEAEGEILKPERADSWELGAKGRLAQLTWTVSAFEMQFENLVIRENVGGLPALANAGQERFKGAEIEAEYQLTPSLQLAASSSWHEAKFTDYRRLRPDGSIQQLSGKYLELSPRQLSAIGFFYAPASTGKPGAKKGWLASAVWNYVGSRFLNKGNTSVAAAYTTVDAGLGYRFGAWSVRLDGTNLANRRDAVAESEIGDAQFYRLPGRVLRVSVDIDF